MRLQIVGCLALSGFVFQMASVQAQEKDRWVTIEIPQCRALVSEKQPDNKNIAVGENLSSPNSIVISQNLPAGKSVNLNLPAGELPAGELPSGLGPPPAPAGSVVTQPATPDPSSTAAAKDAVRRHGKPIRLALTLAGGGARGLAHIGVLKVLEREGLRPDYIAGSSTGAIIGTLFASGLSAAEIEHIARSSNLKKAFFPKPKIVQLLSYVPRYTVARVLGMKPKLGLYSGKSVAKFMDKYLPPGVRNFEDLKIPMAVTAVNLLDTKSIWITKGGIAEAVRASSTMPFMYRPVEKDGRFLVDGATRETLPTDLAEASGAPVVVAVSLYSYIEAVSKGELSSVFGLGDRVSTILMSQIENDALSKANLQIKPRFNDTNLADFNQIDKIIAAGEAATREVLPQIRQAVAAEQRADAGQRQAPM